MSQAFLIFNFGNDEDVAKRARLRLEGWRQGFRLGDKLELRFERTEAASGEEAPASEADAEEESGGEKKAASKKPDVETDKVAEEMPASVRLYVRLGFSNHEKLSYQRWLDRIPAEEPFKNFPPKVVTAGSDAFQSTEDHFESLKHREAGKQRSR